MTKMIKMAMFAFDENKKMIGRVDAESLVDPREFDPEWVTEDALKVVFAEELPAKTHPVPTHVFALLENVNVDTTRAA